MKTAHTLAGLTLALAAVAAPLQAQQQGLPTQPQVPDSIQEMVQEFQTLRARVGQVQDSALDVNPELQDAQAGLQEFIEEKMIETNPDLEENLDRMEALREEAAAAQQAQDNQRLQEIMQEGTRLQNELATAQNEIMQREDVQERVETFEDRMMDAMVEIDTEIDDALDRMEQLAERLQAFQEGG